MKNLKTTLSKIGAVLCGTLLLFSCSKDEGTKPEGKNPAIELDCDYFKQDRVLTNDPEAPVDYIISCEANVTADLKIEPGVVIAFTENASLSFEEKSSFKIEGTADKPIVFTGTVKEKGVWRGVLVESNKASNTMKYVTIEYAGSKSTSHRGEMAPAGLQVAMDGDVKIEHCTFQQCKDNGLFWTSSKYISITNSQFTKNDVPMMSHGVSDIKLYNNTNDYTGNTNDYVPSPDKTGGHRSHVLGLIVKKNFRLLLRNHMVESMNHIKHTIQFFFIEVFTMQFSTLQALNINF